MAIALVLPATTDILLFIDLTFLSGFYSLFNAERTDTQQTGM